MRSLSAKRGFTLIELLVVIAIIAILASILFPVFAKAREKARQTTCLSKVRQIATATLMYDQDNNGRFPGVAPTYWDSALGTYLGGSGNGMFNCPDDPSGDTTLNSYGYNGLLVRADGTGVNESVITTPTEVGVVCDASPSQSFGSGGLVGNGGLSASSMAMIPSPRHSSGTVVGFADGHAAYVPGGFTPQDTSNGVVQAFYMANALGWVQNPAGGLSTFNAAGLTSGATQLNAAVLTIGGDMATMPIITAAAEAWKIKSGMKSYYTRGFLGEGSTMSGATDYVWGYADGTGPGGTNQYAIGKDALVFIVSKNTKIPAAFFDGATDNGVYCASTANIATWWGANEGGGTTSYSANVFQVYGYDASTITVGHYVNGNSAFLQKQGITVGNSAVLATDDINMVSLVGSDPYGIGFCSSAMADPNQVQVLGVLTGGSDYTFPQQNPKYRWIQPTLTTSLPAGFSSFVRTLYAVCGGNAASTGNNANFANSMLASGSGGLQAIQQGPLFQASYWAN